MRLYVATAVLLAGLIAGFAGGWQVPGWRLGLQHTATLAERGKATIRALDRAHDTTAQLQKGVDQARTNAARRAIALRSDAERARAELDGLRHTIATRGDPGTAAPACPAAAHRAATAEELFGQCAGALTDLAEKADRHASDASALVDAWPRLPAGTFIDGGTMPDPADISGSAL